MKPADPQASPAEYSGDPILLTLISYRIDLSPAPATEWFSVDALPKEAGAWWDTVERQQSLQEELVINWPRSFARRDLPFEAYEPSTRLITGDEVGYTFFRKEGANTRLPHDAYFRTGLTPDPAQDRVIYSKRLTLKVPVTEIRRCELEVHEEAHSALRKPLHVVRWPDSVLALERYCLTARDRENLEWFIRDWGDKTFAWIQTNDQIDHP